LVLQQAQLELLVDTGEASAMVLAMETPESMLILDDDKARKLARRLGITFTGTLGVITKAKQRGLVPAVKALLERMKQVGFYISDALEERILRDAKE
jgi:predicted nucleic acid-binding protein